MKYEWKKGDKLRVIDCGCKSSISNGDIVIADNDICTDDKYITDANIINVHGEHCNGFYVHRFEKISSSAKTKVVPEELHAILVDSCKNFVSIKHNYNDAVERAKTEKEAVTIYKLVEVAKVSTLRVVKKVLPKQAPRKKAAKK